MKIVLNFDGHLMHPQNHVQQSSVTFVQETEEQHHQLFHFQEPASEPSPPCQSRTTFSPANKKMKKKIENRK
jgi:hypothetical protein